MLNPPVQPISIGFKLHWFPGVSRNCIYLPNGIFKKENAHQPSDLIGFVVFPNFFQTNPFVFQQSMPFVARIQVAERMQRAQRATSNGVSTTLMKWTLHRSYVGCFFSQRQGPSKHHQDLDRSKISDQNFPLKLNMFFVCSDSLAFHGIILGHSLGHSRGTWLTWPSQAWWMVGRIEWHVKIWGNHLSIQYNP